MPSWKCLPQPDTGALKDGGSSTGDFTVLFSFSPARLIAQRRKGSQN